MDGSDLIDVPVYALLFKSLLDSSQTYEPSRIRGRTFELTASRLYFRRDDHVLYCVQHCSDIRTGVNLPVL